MCSRWGLQGFLAVPTGFYRFVFLDTTLEPICTRLYDFVAAFIFSAIVLIPNRKYSAMSPVISRCARILLHLPMDVI
jgi:hypothetical protein